MDNSENLTKAQLAARETIEKIWRENMGAPASSGLTASSKEWAFMEALLNHKP